MLLQEPVQAAIWDALNHYALQDATFLAERLYAEVKNEDAIFLLATCYYRAGKAMKAYSLLQTRGCTAPQNKYLLARCCVQVNKYSEAENVLAGSALTKCKSNDDIINEFGNSACYILSLLGLIYSKTERTAKASECYRRSLKLNPLLWSSFERLCQLGEKVDVARIFQLPEQNLTHSSGQWLVTNLSNYLHSQNAAQPLSQSTGSSGSSPVITDCRPQTPVSQLNEIILQPGTPDTPLPSMGTLETPASPDPMSVNMAPLKARGRKLERVLLDVPATFSPLTPSFGILPLPMDTPSPGEGSFTTTVPFITPSPTVLPDSQPLAPRASRKMQPVTRRNQNQNQSPMADLRDLPSIFRSHPGGGLLPGMTGNATNVRRSTRLFTNSVKENNKTQPPKTKYSSPKAPGRKTKTRLSKSQQELNEINKGELGVEAKNAANADVATEIQLAQLQRQSLVGILSLLQTVGRAYQTQCQYECERAIELYSELPPQQYNTAWVLCQVGRAYSLLAQYQKAEKVFAAVRQLEPYHVEGMEMYSTTLWHLQRDVQLSALAQELTEMDKNAPEGWCAAGNCFSLQKEHDAAIKFFQRAIQVAPDFAYAYTLLGHEYAFTEELDKALSCFRNAVRVDPRHYNARYGVGMIYYKQEKFNLAEVHFRKALSIFPDNSILLCHIGVVQHSLQKTDSALNTLNRAIAVDPKNPLCKFHRASVLFANDRHQEALAELEELKEIVPTESLVYFLIGKVHKKLGNTHLALMNFSWAMDLDPKGANNQIKEAIDKRYVTEEEEGDSSARLDTTGLDESDAIPGEAGNASNSWDDVFLRDRDEDAQAQMLESYESL